METVIGVIVGLIVGGLACWLVQEFRNKARVAKMEGQLEQVSSTDQIVEAAKQQLGESFQATAAQALQSNNEQFLTLARENLGRTVESAKGELEKRHEQFQTLVKPLTENYEKLNPQIESLIKHGQSLATETGKLSSALTDSRQVGSWGEIQLRRVVELAGMVEHCDFREQTTVDGALDRPDLMVNLPERRTVVVDAKASTAAYLEAQQADNDVEETDAMKRHAGALRKQVDDLAGKDYGSKVDGSLDFVVMFVPGDQFLAAALNANPQLIEYAMGRRVAIATPASLISLLWAVSNGWQQYRIAESAEEIRQTGEAMHERLRVFLSHYGKIGKELKSVVDAYNSSVGSYEVRLAPQGRRFAELLGKAEDDLIPPPRISEDIRPVRGALDEGTG